MNLFDVEVSPNGTTLLILHAQEHPSHGRRELSPRWAGQGSPPAHPCGWARAVLRFSEERTFHYQESKRK